MKLRILHAVSIVADVFSAFPCFGVYDAMKVQLCKERFQAALVEFVITLLNPLLALFAVSIDDLSNLTEMLFGVKPIQDLNGAGEQFSGRVPDPRRTIA